MANPKREALEALLKTTWAYLHVDGRMSGVDLPDWLREPAVKLQLGYDMPLPIPDLRIDDEGVVATLSFRRIPHRCVLPWSAVYAVTDLDGQGVMFPADVPAEVQGSFAAAPAPGSPPAAAAAAEDVPAAATAAPEPARAGKKPRPSHLKLVP